MTGRSPKPCSFCGDPRPAGCHVTYDGTRRVACPSCRNELQVRMDRGRRPADDGRSDFARSIAGMKARLDEPWSCGPGCSFSTEWIRGKARHQETCDAWRRTARADDLYRSQRGVTR